MFSLFVSSNKLKKRTCRFTGAAVATASETHSIPSSSAVGSSRTVRLFGVNLECQRDEDDGDDSVAATTATECPDGYYGQNMYYYYTPHPHNMVILLFTFEMLY